MLVANICIGRFSGSARSVLQPVGNMPKNLSDISDPAVFAMLFRALSPVLSSYARRLSGHRDIEELVQETWLRAWRARHGFEPGTNIRAWLLTILRNLFLDEARRRKKMVPVSDQQAEHVASEGQQERSVEIGRAWDLIGQLPLEQQETIMMIAADGLSHREAAERLGVATGTTKARIHRARAILNRANPGAHADAIRGVMTASEGY